MTEDLRNRAMEAGWHPEVVRNLSVTFDGKKFTSEVHPDYLERAFEYEYGTEDIRATAVMRKFVSQHHDGEQSFVVNFHQNIEGHK